MKNGFKNIIIINANFMFATVAAVCPEKQIKALKTNGTNKLNKFIIKSNISLYDSNNHHKSSYKK